MNKVEFLARLNQILSDLPEEERTEAVSYYEEYLAEAGPEREAELLMEFGSPERVAAEIRENLYGGIERGGVYTETGYRESTADGMGTALDHFTQITAGAEKQSEAGAGEENSAQGSDTAYRWTDNKSSYTAKEEKGTERQEGKKLSGMSSSTKAILIALVILFAVPIGAVLISVLGGVFGVVMAALGLLLGLVVGTIGFLISGVAVVVTGIMNLASATASGFLLCGLGCLLFVVGVLLLMATGFVFGTALPWLIRRIRQFVRVLSEKRKGRVA